MNSVTVLINYTPSQDKVQIVSLIGAIVTNELNALYNNVVLRENTTVGRIYIVNKQDTDQEVLSLPLSNCIIRTNY